MVCAHTDGLGDYFDRRGSKTGSRKQGVADLVVEPPDSRSDQF